MNEYNLTVGATELQGNGLRHVYEQLLAAQGGGLPAFEEWVVASVRQCAHGFFDGCAERLKADLARSPDVVDMVEQLAAQTPEARAASLASMKAQVAPVLGGK